MGGELRGYRFAEAALARSPLQGIAGQVSRRRLCVLAYHGVSDADRFTAHLDWLCGHTNPVALSDVRAAMRDGRPLPPHAVLVTFDDGERSVLEVGAPLLRERGIPGVAFVVAGVVDTDTPFWWTEVEALAPAHEATALVRRFKRLPDSERREAVRRLRAQADQPVRTSQLTSDELRKLELDGIAIGNHSLSHPCLDNCTDDVLRAEVQDAHERLTEMLGHQPDAFAYPNGNWDSRVRSEVSAAGYDLAFAFDHRLSPVPAPDPLVISRVRVDATASLERFRILVSGLHSGIHRMRGLP
ncbi:MAG TPA: polysaccharide deacetylase family protein [Nocardioidaceae bacterium]|nr:polysaccharide deacetylase family protein [Nocardioidaceae bacterium]